MGKNITEAVREVCLSFPESEERPSRGSPDFRVREKTFATYAVNHHGDGRIALWLNAPDGAQRFYSENEPEYYFVPPYVGPRGWLGVELDRGLDWRTVAQTGARGLREDRAGRPRADPRAHDRDRAAHRDPGRGGIRPPARAARPGEAGKPAHAVSRTAGNQRVDPVRHPPPSRPARRRSAARTATAAACTWRSGWVGTGRPCSLSTSVIRFRGTPGHNGWIHLDVEDQVDWDEVRALALESYRHFALQRMLKALPAEA